MDQEGKRSNLGKSVQFAALVGAVLELLAFALQSLTFAIIAIVEVLFIGGVYLILGEPASFPTREWKERWDRTSSTRARLST